jgi:6-phosphogluconolactonase (cycloisomerase 2 family)
MKLHSSVRAVAAATLTLGIGLIATSGSASASPPGFGGLGPQFSFGATHGHALFVETDATSGNQILTYRRGGDGTVSFVQSFATGGDGAIAAGATADPLASQGGLTLVNNGSELIATNAGSDTVTVFGVDGSHLFYVQQIGSGGQFPDSVASHGNLVAVLNAGSTGTVAEFQLVGGFLVPLLGQTRSLSLANTTPPDFHHGAGEVAYTPNGQHLIITTKLSDNSYEVFSVAGNGTLGTSAKDTSSDNDLPFSFTFDSAGNVVATEAATSSVSVYAVNANGSLSSLGSVSDGAAALCWISGANGYYYGSNAGSGTISSFDENGAGAPQLVSATAATAHAGTTDSVVSPDGSFLYVESGGAGTIDAYAIGATGSLTPIETIFNIPVGSEGIAVS